MKIKIIKRTEREKATTADFALSSQPKESDKRKTMTVTVKSWIEDLRRKPKGDAALFKKLFKPESCS